MEAGRNPVGRLQEACQRWRLPLPTYREAQGSYQEFGCECLIATAEGAEPVVLYHRARTKKASKAGAAQAALDHLAEHTGSSLSPTTNGGGLSVILCASGGTTCLIYACSLNKTWEDSMIPYT